MTKVITYGTYDLFHEGHYKLLERAKALGDYLIVGVTTEHFDEARGKVNVVDSIMERIENVRNTGFADEIIIEDHEGQKIEDIQKYKVDIFTVGSDWNGTFDYLNQFCKVVYLERTPDISSTMLRKTKFQIVNMGIVGTGRIVRRFIEEEKYVSGCNFRCTYNPTVCDEHAIEHRHDLVNFHGEYEKFLELVEAVYIASPNETHYDYAKRALACGKHVLCEKPIAFTRKESEELYQYAASHGLVLMEAVKTAYCPGFQQLINVAKSGKIGEICDVEACFTRLAAVGSRERTDAKYGGSFLEFSSYTLLPAIKLLGTAYRDIHFDILTDENGVDVYTKVALGYDGKTALAKNGVAVKSEGQLVIAGTKGYILAPSPWWLTKRFEIHYENPGEVEVYEPTFQGEGFRYEISDFISKINGIDRNGYKLTAEEAVAMAGITEAFMREKEKSV